MKRFVVNFEGVVGVCGEMNEMKYSGGDRGRGKNKPSVWNRAITSTYVDVYLLACAATMVRDVEYLWYNRNPFGLFWFPPCVAGIVISAIIAGLGYWVMRFGRSRKWPGWVCTGLTAAFVLGLVKLLPTAG